MTSELRERYKRWIKYFRQNPEEFAEQVLGLSLLPYQKYVVHNMLQADSSFFLASRASAKSFLTAVVAVVYALLYPGARVVVSASVESQASLLISSKIKAELTERLSPYLREQYRLGLIEFSRTDAGAQQVEFKSNGSTIIGCAPIASSRGLRCNLLVLDEIRLMSQQSISSILMPMRHRRIPVYSEDQTDGENAKVVCLTSSGYAFESWCNTWRQHIIRSIQPNERQRLKYFICAFDIYACIQQGLKSMEDLESLRDNTDKTNFEIECLNIIAGAISDGFFDAGLFIPQQKINVSLKRQKEEDNQRIIAVDIAFQSASQNDNTIIIACDVNTITGQRRVDYIEQFEASDSAGLVYRIKELFKLYDADICCIDARSGGRIIAQELMTDTGVYGGFGLADNYLQVIKDSTLNEYAQWVCEDPEYYCFVPIIATAQSNDLMWNELMQSLKSGLWLFPKNASDAEAAMLEDNSFYELSSVEYAEKLAPYLQTDRLIEEAVNLRAERKNNLLHLKEPRNGNATKDRIVALAYANTIANKVINGMTQIRYTHDSWLQDMPCFW